ncbi:MAG: hypothetical protein M1830_008288 [Pleopsidium flavum]|nr:MAG: hypothetical protein M1830_008288 [Pleopsidium flavum]
MSFKLSELLNPVPSSDPPSPRSHQQDLPPQQSPHTSQNTAPIFPHSQNSSYSEFAPVASEHDAANALADLATRGPVSINPLNKRNISSSSPQINQGSYSQSPPRPISSYGLVATPVEPSPPLERAQQPFSPTLDQYHHSSRSADHQRRQSLASARSSPPPRLAPIQSYPDMIGEQQVFDFEDRKAYLTPKVDASTVEDNMEGVQQTAEIQQSDRPRAEPVTGQNRHPSPGPPPPAQEAEPIVSSPPPPEVKAEPSATPRESTPQTPVPLTLNKDDASTRATPVANDFGPSKYVASLKQEESTRGSSAEAPPPLTSTPETASKKRAAPRGGTKTEKKGIASSIKKPATKKRRIGSESLDGTPSSRRSATPSSRASKTPAPRNRKQTSATPASSSPAPSNLNDAVVDEDDEMGDADADYEEGTELFCICRKPDNHTWMIGCDGGCEDWFHGKCVDIKEEDGDLIDKKPARLSLKEPSKYCSDEHGREFMRSHSHKHRTKTNGLEEGPGKKKRRKDNYTDHDGNGQVDDEEMEESRGGVLRGGELKAVVKAIKDVNEFRTVGDQVLSPPPTIGSDGDAKVDGQSGGERKVNVVYSAEEETKLAEITGKKEVLKGNRTMLGDKEVFLGMVKERAKQIKEAEGVKELCGYDSRLTWSNDEFETWRLSAEGKKVFEGGVLVFAPSTSTEFDLGAVVEDEGKAAGKEVMAQVVCTKKRCERHKQWLKIQQQELAFEKDALRQEMRRLDNEEKELMQGAVLRGVEQGTRGPVITIDPTI